MGPPDVRSYDGGSQGGTRPRHGPLAFESLARPRLAWRDSPASRDGLRRGPIAGDRRARRSGGRGIRPHHGAQPRGRAGHRQEPAAAHGRGHRDRPGIRHRRRLGRRGDPRPVPGRARIFSADELREGGADAHDPALDRAGEILAGQDDPAFAGLPPTDRALRVHRPGDPRAPVGGPRATDRAPARRPPVGRPGQPAPSALPRPDAARTSGLHRDGTSARGGRLGDGARHAARRHGPDGAGPAHPGRSVPPGRDGRDAPPDAGRSGHAGHGRDDPGAGRGRPVRDRGTGPRLPRRRPAPDRRRVVVALSAGRQARPLEHPDARPAARGAPARRRPHGPCRSRHPRPDVPRGRRVRDPARARRPGVRSGGAGRVLRAGGRGRPDHARRRALRRRLHVRPRAGLHVRDELAAAGPAARDPRGGRRAPGRGRRPARPPRWRPSPATRSRPRTSSGAPASRSRPRRRRSRATPRRRRSADRGRARRGLGPGGPGRAAAAPRRRLQRAAPRPRIASRASPSSPRSRTPRTTPRSNARCCSGARRRCDSTISRTAPPCSRRTCASGPRRTATCAWSSPPASSSARRSCGRRWARRSRRRPHESDFEAAEEPFARAAAIAEQLGDTARSRPRRGSSA